MERDVQALTRRVVLTYNIPIKEAAYRATATNSRYLNPNTIELYSAKPPNMAPAMLKPNARSASATSYLGESVGEFSCGRVECLAMSRETLDVLLQFGSFAVLLVAAGGHADAGGS